MSHYAVKISNKGKDSWLLYVNGKPFCFGDAKTIMWLLNRVNLVGVN